MTTELFIATWQDNPLNERAGAQVPFDDLCDPLGVPKPHEILRFLLALNLQRAVS